MTPRTNIKRIAKAVPTLWIVITALVYFTRFSTAFYNANRAAIDALLNLE